MFQYGIRQMCRMSLKTLKAEKHCCFLGLIDHTYSCQLVATHVALILSENDIVTSHFAHAISSYLKPPYLAEHFLAQWGTLILASESPVFFAFSAITPVLVNIFAPNLKEMFRF